MVCNQKTNRACTIGWRAKKIKRVVNSSLAAEALAMLDTIGEVIYNKAVLEMIFGARINKVPVVITNDSQNLYKAIYSTSLVEDAWSITDIAAIKEAMEDKKIDVVKQVPGAEMVANCLTKQGAGAVQLMEVLKEGRYELPGGWSCLKRNQD